MIKLFSVLGFLTLLSACDCNQVVQGMVVDQETGKPLINASVTNQYKAYDKTVTDSTGRFVLSSISGGFRCPPMELVVEHPGYKKLETSIPAGGDKTIRLEKE